MGSKILDSYLEDAHLKSPSKTVERHRSSSFLFLVEFIFLNLEEGVLISSSFFFPPLPLFPSQFHMLPRIRILSTLAPRHITPSYLIPQRPLSLHSTLFNRMSSSTSSQQPPAEPTTTTNNNNHQTEEQNEDSPSKPTLALPAPGDFSSMTSGTPSLEVNGQDIKLDLLGPVGKSRPPFSPLPLFLKSHACVHCIPDPPYLTIETSFFLN